MTKEREEKLISDSAYTAAALATFLKEWETAKCGFASKESVEAVNDKIDTHERGHVNLGVLLATWGGVAVALIMGIVSLLRKNVIGS